MKYASDALDFLTYLFDKVDNVDEYLDDFGMTYEQVDEGIRSLVCLVNGEGMLG